MSDVAYRRLPGKRRTLAEVATLYLGPDHILMVRSTRINEDYQRFYFQDVQSILVRKTAMFHFVWAAILVVLAMLAASVTRDIRWPLGILASGGVFLWVRGPSCEVRLHTGVTAERLRSLHRLKTAERVIPILREQIESVQGRLVSAPEDYAAHMASTPPPLTIAASTQALRPRGKDHVFFFSFLALEAALVGASVAAPSHALNLAAGAAALIEFLAFVIVLVRQTQQRVPRALRNITYFAAARWFITQAAGMFLAYKAFFFDGVKTTMDPLTFVRGTLSYVTLVSMLATAGAGLWFSLRSGDE